MSTIIEEYLDSVKSNLRLDTPDENEIISELAAHIEDKVQELKKIGLRDEEAASTCIRLLGSAKLVARQIYEAHSQGSWRQALLASLPHLIFGMIFVLNWWKGIIPVLIALIAVSSIAVYGWWHSKSTWLFPWLGYSLLPVTAGGLALLYLPRTLAWIAIIIYLPLALWLIIRIVSQTLKKDWLYLSLMLFPLPIIICWFLVAEWKGYFDADTLASLYQYGPWIGLSFLGLAFSVITFVRIRKRWLKISSLFLTGAITLTLISSYARGRIGIVTLLLLILILVCIFLVPALLENGVRSGKWGKIFEHRPLS